MTNVIATPVQTQLDSILQSPWLRCPGAQGDLVHDQVRKGTLVASASMRFAR